MISARLLVHYDFERKKNEFQLKRIRSSCQWWLHWWWWLRASHCIFFSPIHCTCRTKTTDEDMYHRHQQSQKLKIWIWKWKNEKWGKKELNASAHIIIWIWKFERQRYSWMSVGNAVEKNRLKTMKNIILFRCETIDRRKWSVHEPNAFTFSVVLFGFQLNVQRMRMR